MTLRKSITTCLGPLYFFKFKGRASRSEYWWFALFMFLVNISSSIFWLLPSAIASSLSLLLGLALLPASLGVTVRRLHDRNLSGWWLTVPFTLIASLGLFGHAVFTPLADLLSFGVCLILLIILCMPSQPGPNRYGPNPLGDNGPQQGISA